MSQKRALRVHVFGGTAACDPRPKVHPDDEDVFDPRRGKIPEIVEYELPQSVRNAFRRVLVTEEDNLFDSAQAYHDTIMHVVARIREVLKEMAADEDLVCVWGTDRAAPIMQATVEGISQQMLGNRAVIGYCKQRAAPMRTPGSSNKHFDDNEPIVKDLSNVFYLVGTPEMHENPNGDAGGRVGHFCGGVLLSARGALKTNTRDDQPFVSRFDPIAKAGPNIEMAWQDAYVKGMPNWEFYPSGWNSIPRGKPWKYVLKRGVECNVMLTTSSYGNLVRMVSGLMSEDPSLPPKKANGLIVQLPGNRSMSQNSEDMQYVHEAAMAGRGEIPLVLAGGLLYPEQRHGTYPGDIKLLMNSFREIAEQDPQYEVCRSHPDFSKISLAQNEDFQMHGTPVLIAGDMSLHELELELSRIMHRAKSTKGINGWYRSEYAQACLNDYELFLQSGY